MRKNHQPSSLSDLEKHVGISIFTTTTPGICGELKVQPEDFLVCEITPNGRVLSIVEKLDFHKKPNKPSRHVYTQLDVVKRNEDTILVAEKIARALNIEPQLVSWAGLKDNRAITAQRMTIKGDCVNQLLHCRFDTVFLKNFQYVKKPIKLGDLWGNKFDIIMRNIIDINRDKLDSIASNFMNQIATFGSPNYYGLQRFGSIRPNSHIVGKYLFLSDYQKAVEEFLYATYPPEHEIVKICRKELKETQNFEQGLRNFPEGLYYERLIMQQLLRKPQDYLGAIKHLPRPLVNLLMSSYQSYLFNSAISKRMMKFGNLIEPKTNDIISLLLDDNGLTTPLRYRYKKWKKPFLRKVLNMDRARIMCPILGYDSKLSDSYFGRIYKRILKKENFKLDYFKNGKELRAYDFRGSFRSIIVKPRDLQVVPHYEQINPIIRMKFSLPKGTYATMLIRELSKH
ncbi:MAG: tRNA pseudouridine(13) synthase TruD [Candidatus Lokiarchaeota archaeon]|nr:tRNA pseudouridine(13) synthase TruD [Candidatus Lokiarchaeota archaeon]